jgi:hypothetical protein
MLMLLAGCTLAVSPRFAFTANTQPDAKKLPACCGDKCKKMEGCCSTDDKGKTTCSMGGSCCVKTDKK